MSEIQTENSGTMSSSPLNSILSDPAAISSLLSAMKPSNTQNDSEAPPTSSLGGNDILSGLLSNPEMLSKLPAMIETVKPLLQNFSPPENSPRHEVEKVHNDKGHDRRVALLLALKPYLSQSRCEAIDYMVKISGITEMFR